MPSQRSGAVLCTKSHAGFVGKRIFFLLSNSFVKYTFFFSFNKIFNIKLKFIDLELRIINDRRTFFLLLKLRAQNNVRTVARVISYARAMSF